MPKRSVSSNFSRDRTSGWVVERLGETLARSPVVIVTRRAKGLALMGIGAERETNGGRIKSVTAEGNCR